jgi:hypothetical protein
MKLDAPFIRLPYRFDAAAVLAEVMALDDSLWQDHPRGWDGHRAAALVSADGGSDLTRFDGEMKATEALEKLPAIQHLLSALDTVVGRTMLVRAEPGKEAQRLVDAGSYWHRRVRVVLPIQAGDSGCSGRSGSPPASRFLPARPGWSMAGGAMSHRNPGSEALIYLVVDTVGSASFWSTVNSADRPLDPERESMMSPRQVKLDGAAKAIETEIIRTSRVMSPWELESLVNGVMQDLRSVVPPDAPHLPKLESALSQFMRQWQGVHARHGEDEAGDAAYKQALEQLVAQAAMFAGVVEAAQRPGRRRTPLPVRGPGRAERRGRQAGGDSPARRQGAPGPGGPAARAAGAAGAGGRRRQRTGSGARPRNFGRARAARRISPSARRRPRTPSGPVQATTAQAPQGAAGPSRKPIPRTLRIRPSLRCAVSIRRACRNYCARRPARFWSPPIKPASWSFCARTRAT